MKNQITKETVYRIPADVKRESAVTLQEKHLLQKFTNILREDGKNYWFNAERFLRTDFCGQRKNTTLQFQA